MTRDIGKALARVAGLVLVGVLLAVGPPQGVLAGQDWVNYANARYGFRLEYPAYLLMPQPPPDNDDGRTFVSADGEAKLLVFATHNVEALTPATYAEALSDDTSQYDRVTYRAVREDWFVVSGHRGEDIVYHKVVFTCAWQIMTQLHLSYPASQRATYDPLVDRLQKSLGPGKCCSTCPP